ncbi:MAG: hypothetical protein EBR01_10290 [Proteobacteria bacterium]|nr:hypothetical protein [Pseudomonadota bacterium]
MLINSKKFQSLKLEIQEALRNSRCEELKSLKIVQRDSSDPIDLSALKNSDKKIFGEKILKLYFFQIFHLRRLILDLSPKSFLEEGSWAPRPIFYEFQPEFLMGVRKIYQGLFTNAPALFQEGLRDLGIESLEKNIIQHFKKADQNPIYFLASDLNHSALSILSTLIRTRTIPPKDSVALGICLGLLYQSLSRIDEPLDIAKAFRAATNANSKLSNL